MTNYKIKQKGSNLDKATVKPLSTLMNKEDPYDKVRMTRGKNGKQ